MGFQAGVLSVSLPPLSLSPSLFSRSPLSLHPSLALPPSLALMPYGTLSAMAPSLDGSLSLLCSDHPAVHTDRANVRSRRPCHKFTF
ncbi:hypothetical protein DPEC_G00171920 [Dallia pectoralis]|uniref:Uncharacterized protein n=1 Tax=Dallia pectoralis TaxID=75939 RepID=A0ACC2GDZ3_DALPE|nr:hypothetical protein DPEC_G00171920 [Dallia pectoralis]